MKWIHKRPPRAVADPIREAALCRARMGADQVTPVGIAANAVAGDAYPYAVVGATVAGAVIGTLRSGPLWGIVWLIGSNIVAKIAAQGACAIANVGPHTGSDCGRGSWIF